MSGNPLLNMMSNGGPMAMLQNSPIGQLISMFKGGGNPQAMIQQMMGQNPQFGDAINSLNGKDQNQINNFISQTAKEKGINLAELASSIGMPPEIAAKYGIELPK